MFQYCDIYESSGFTLSKLEEGERPMLTLNFEKVARLIPDEKATGVYQVIILKWIGSLTFFFH